jgi:hypothetical protein
VPSAIGAQIPSGEPVMASTQAAQVCVHSELQHTPSTHWPPRHCEEPLQGAPGCCGATHTELLQKLPCAQSALVVQLCAQAALAPDPWHVFGLQLTGMDGMQVPLPLQVKAGESTGPLHEAGKHSVPAA